MSARDAKKTAAGIAALMIEQYIHRKGVVNGVAEEDQDKVVAALIRLRDEMFRRGEA